MAEKLLARDLLPLCLFLMLEARESVLGLVSWFQRSLRSVVDRVVVVLELNCGWTNCPGSSTNLSGV